MRTEIRRPLLAILVSFIALVVEAWCIWKFHIGVRLSDDYVDMRAFEVGDCIAPLVDSGRLALSGRGSRNPGGDMEEVWLAIVGGRKIYVIADERGIVKGIAPVVDSTAE